MTLGDQDGRVNQNTATLTINVVRNQFTPRFLNEPYTIEINENIGTSQSIYQVTAIDDDPINTFERVTYQVTGDSNAPAFFNVNANTGSISLTQSLASNVDVTYNLRITAFDNGFPSRSNSTIVYITVDRNRNAPFFQPISYSAGVAESGALGSEVVQVTALDRDTVSPYNVVRYVLRDTVGSQFFFINEETGMIYVSRSIALDQNAAGQYQLNVGAYDLGTPSRVASQDASVILTVTRNQFSPVFVNEPYSISIEQSRPIGNFVLRVTAVDSDTVSPYGDVTLRLIGDDDGTVYFGFNAASGNITVARDLTTDTATYYQLRIEARDGGSPSRSATALVGINVQRNLFDPQWRDLFYNVTIDETQQLGTTIIQLSAQDQDIRSPHNVITYTMSNNFGVNTLAAQYFTVNSATGAITLRQSLLNDNTDTRRFTFTVSITDNGVPVRTASSVANVEINVIRNTVAPFFVNTPYDRQINYTTNVGALIFTATARDNDVSPYNIITYDMIGDGDATVFFGIDSSTGQVRLQQSVFSETTTQYRVWLSHLNFLFNV